MSGDNAGYSILLFLYLEEQDNQHSRNWSDRSALTKSSLKEYASSKSLRYAEIVLVDKFLTNTHQLKKLSSNSAVSIQPT